MRAHDIESENLEAHVSICQERYQQLADKLDAFDGRMSKLEALVVDIHQDIEGLRDRQNSRWDNARDVIIGVLLAVTGFLLSNSLF